MSELIQKNSSFESNHWKLFSSVSVAALIASTYCVGLALAEEDAGRSQVWIELGSQLEQSKGGDPAFEPLFFNQVNAQFTSPAKMANELSQSIGPEGKITFKPEGSDWVFSAGVRYGRAKSHRDRSQVGKPVEIENMSRTVFRHPYTFGGNTYYYTTIKCCHPNIHTPTRAEFSDVQSSHQESHLILDFQAGKDVGLGLFGHYGTSVLSAGVRFAQFQTKMDVSVKARTDLQHYNFLTANYLTQYPQKYFGVTRFRNYSLIAGAERSFRGMGPSISWDASATLLGNAESSQLTFDWGINAAILFGKQKSSTHHQTDSSHYYAKYTSQHGKYYQPAYDHPRVNHIRSRSVTVPNIGGMAGFSIKFPNAKVSMGYRADFFFGAIDGGWDTAKSENRSFHGPFATVSIGLGG